MNNYIMKKMLPEERIMAKLKPGCICKGIKLISVIECIEKGARTVAEVQQQLNIGNGSCKGKRCSLIIETQLEKIQAS